MLVLIHRCQLGLAPPCVASFFPRVESTLHKFNFGVPAHDRQVACRVSPGCPIIFRRSIFALVRVYNALPIQIVDARKINVFQRRLQMELKTSAKNDVQDWYKKYHIVD